MYISHVRFSASVLAPRTSHLAAVLYFPLKLHTPLDRKVARAPFSLGENRRDIT